MTHLFTKQTSKTKGGGGFKFQVRLKMTSFSKKYHKIESDLTRN